MAEKEVGMSEPGVVESTLDGESVAADVPLGGEDRLYITPTRTLIYRAEGLLSDESVEEYPHGAERLTVSEGRRKTRFRLDYPIDGTREFTIPSNRAEDALHPVLAGILNAGGITEPGETVLTTYRFSELTLVITSERVVKHIGAAVWDDDYEEYHFADITGLSFEEGSVATQIVIEIDGRQQRIKAPNDTARDVQERLSQALFSFHDVSSMEELLTAVSPDEDDGEDEPIGGDRSVDFGEGVDPLEANPPAMDDDDRPVNATAPTDTTDEHAGADEVGPSGSTHHSSSAQRSHDRSNPAADAPEAVEGDDASVEAADPLEPTGEKREDASAEPASSGSPTETTTERSGTAEEESASDDDLGFNFEDVGFEPADGAEETDDIAEELAELRAVVEHQNERLDKQRQAIERLIEELSRGR